MYNYPGMFTTSSAQTLLTRIGAPGFNAPPGYGGAPGMAPPGMGGSIPLDNSACSTNCANKTNIS
jgi:hypothetical protein